MKCCPACRSTYPTHTSFCALDGNALVEFQEWVEGAVIRSKYRILTRVGYGGMGTVYKALHIRFEELRALKVLNRELMIDPRVPRRFEQEAFAARKLVHPNVVRVEDIDVSDEGQPFIAMEFVEGGNLGTVLETEGALSVARTCSIVKQIASALDSAHHLGIIHRDIKPHNIALVHGATGTNGNLQVKVLDFGIAKLQQVGAEGISPKSALTQTGLIVGTPQYMSPEQAKGKRDDDLDGRSDIYSLGVVMYQMLTGALPFEASTTVEMLLAHLQEPPRPLETLRPDLNIPGPISQIVMQCLEKNRELRPLAGKALIQAIERAEEELRSAGSRSVVFVERAAMPLSAAEPSVPATEAAAISSGTLLASLTPPTPLTAPSQLTPSTPLLAAEIALESAADEQPAISAADTSQGFSDPIPPEASLPVAPVTPTATHAAARPVRSAGWPIWAIVALGVVLVVSLGFFLARRRTVSNVHPIQQQPQQVTSAPVAPAAPAAIPSTLQNISETAVEQKQAVGAVEAATSLEDSHPPQAGNDNSGQQKGSLFTSPMPKPVIPVLSPAEKAERDKEVRGALTEGNVFYENGEYANAIRAYSRGLKLDSQNPDLKRGLKKAKNARATERKENQ